MTRAEVFAVASAGRSLRVTADSPIVAWWPQIAVHVPGADPGPLAVLDTDAETDLRLDGGVDAADARRLINAHLHLLHLRHATLCLHAVVLARPDRRGTIVLLGGHGAGKTLVGIALAERGWRPVAGDVALLDVAPELRVRGGTSAVLARRAAVARWFPDLPLAAVATDRVELHGRWAGRALREVGPPLAAVLVDVDGDPRAAAADIQSVDEHTARTVWLRASTHLLDRVLHSSPTVLRLLEDRAAAHQRMTLVDEVAARLALHTAWGAPRDIATQVEELTCAALAARAEVGR